MWHGSRNGRAPHAAPPVGSTSIRPIRSLMPNSAHLLDMFESWAKVEVAMQRRCRLLHMSYRTEQSYVGWVRRFRAFVDGKLPRGIAPEDVEGFLSRLPERYALMARLIYGAGASTANATEPRPVSYM